LAICGIRHSRTPVEESANYTGEALLAPRMPGAHSHFAYHECLPLSSVEVG
jgi:hypothetical protein